MRHTPKSLGRSPFLLGLTAAVIILFACPPAVAQATIEARLRDGLLEHFSQQNLLPVMLPRDHAVGDVLEPSGAFRARRKDCFPNLSTEPPKPTATLTALVITDKAEGGFGIGLKRIIDVLLKAGASKSTQMRITFLDQTFVSATTQQIRRAYEATRCPDLKIVLNEGFMDATAKGAALFVLQEVFYARKRVEVEVGTEIDTSAVLKDINAGLSPLQLEASVTAAGKTGKSIVVESNVSLPIAVRVAFLPRTVGGVTLGGKGSNDAEGLMWQDAQKMPPTMRKASNAAAADLMRAETNGEANPLLGD